MCLTSGIALLSQHSSVTLLRLTCAAVTPSVQRYISVSDPAEPAAVAQDHAEHSSEWQEHQHTLKNFILLHQMKIAQ